MPPTISLEAGMPIVNKIREILLASSRSHHRGLAARPSGRRQRCGGLLQCGVLRAAEAVRRVALPGYNQGQADRRLAGRVSKEFVGIDFNFSQYIQDNVEEGLSGVKGANSAKIIGPDLRTLEQIARAAMREMAQVQGITDLGAFWVLGQPNLNIRIDRAKAARYGLSVNDVNSVVQAALGGTVATTLLEADRQFGVVVRLRPNTATTSTTCASIKVGYQTPSGVNAYIPLSELADISLDTGASYIFRERNQRFVPIKFSVRGRDLAGAVEERKSGSAKT
jgi:cobalt-zinc-cadmium resistance protein CzcA